MLPFDLHVLGMPPAFNLSQDQTLQFNLFSLLLSVSFNTQSLRVPTQFVFSLLNELCPEGVLRILLIHTSLSISFFVFLEILFVS